MGDNVNSNDTIIVDGGVSEIASNVNSSADDMVKREKEEFEKSSGGSFNGNKHRKKGTITKFVVGGLVTVALIGGGVFAYQKYSEYTRYHSEFEQKVNQITEIDYSQQQEALNQAVADGMINIQYSIHAVFNGTDSETFNVKNIKNNKYPLVFSLYDEDGKCIYESQQVELGYEVNTIRLSKKLSVGTHEGTIKIGYAKEGNVASTFPITIEVK